MCIQVDKKNKNKKKPSNDKEALVTYKLFKPNEIMLDQTEKSECIAWYLEINSHAIQSSMFWFVCLFDFEHSEHVRHTLDHKVAVMPKQTRCNDGLKDSTSIWKVYFYNTQTVQHSAYLFVMK